ncbi:helix-turn-helix transcriptional regulator [Micromonospora sonneratiae]
MTAGNVAGRQELVQQALAHWESGRGAVLVGDAGMGKSTVLAALAHVVRQQPGLVLSASPTEADARMPFVTLIDLFAGVPADHFDRLPLATLRIVEVALRRRDPAGGEVDSLAVCLGIFDLLRTISEVVSTTLVLDDLQWVDPASAEVLSFAVRRLAAERLKVLAALRSGAAPDWKPAGVTTLQVGPLASEALVPVVMQRAADLVSRPIAQQICTLSGGNPLFALEIADAVQRGGVRPVPGQPLPVPVHLDTLMRQRLAALSRTARDTVRLAATAYRPTLALLVQAGCDTAVADLTAASEAGVCDLDGNGTVSFGHPLLRAAVYSEAPVIVRMSMHARLVEVITDPIERARHLALATGLEDPTVAAALTTAAELASGQGAAGVARELIGLAALRTPVTDRAGWAERKLTEARYAHLAGLLSEAREAAEAVLAADVPRRFRTRARLAVFDASGNAIGRMGEQVAAACAEAEDDVELEPWVRVYSAVHHAAALRTGPALADAAWAAKAAGTVGDVRAELRALHVLLSMKARLGQPTEEEMDRANRLMERRTDLGEAAYLIHYELARTHLDNDRYDEAHDTLQQAARLAGEFGTFGGLEWVLYLLARVDWLRGRYDCALATVSRLQQLAVDVEPAYGHLVLWASAEAEAATGSLPRAIELAERVIEETERVGDVERLACFGHLLGTWRLLAGDFPGAVTTLQRAWGRLSSIAPDNQTRMLLADLVEALVDAGDLAQARDLLVQLHDTDVGSASPRATAATRRATAVLSFAEGRADDAIALLGSSADVYRRLGTPIELVRVLVLAAGIERRRRRRATARGLLDEAAQLCRTAGATTWSGRVEAERARLTPTPRGQNTPLTPMEERIAALVVQGATNREIARTLSIAVTTVEGSLTKIYRQFHIRSRVELVRTLGHP